ncbi:MAG TPA: multicopper oxidase domain-containing protein [Terriglobales bacterium]|nr:multicopper oxidase domain-containing protein [Terriglobales bacterium]
MRHLARAGEILLFLCMALLSRANDSPLPVVAANDNRTAAGELHDGVLNLHLELAQGRWYPENEGGLHRDIYAFAETGQAPQSPGPLIRVPQGTKIHATIHNSLSLATRIYGLHQHPGDPNEALRLQPGEARDVQFLATQPGTYLYWAATSAHSLGDREGPESMLSGAFIVDAPGAKTDDRIFVLASHKGLGEDIHSINGKSWPYTERFTFSLGETVHWRIVNPTWTDHAFHLHGFFFKVDAVGDGEHYERYAEDQRRLGVTEHVDSGHTFEMTWTPERAGNWLFHCHMVTHMSPPELPPGETPSAAASDHEHSAGMGGLVIGITVRADAKARQASASTARAHRVQLVVSDNPGKVPLYSLQVNDPRQPAPTQKDQRPSLLGPPIFLTRGEPAEIEVKNQSSSPTAIHWHGIELESYYDGVPGWTGSGPQRSPAIAPGSSFVARMTPPRAGTFIYHTHWHDDQQIANGMYGPLIVLEPGQKFDAEHDRIFVISAGHYVPFGFLLLVNGHPQPDTLDLQAATRYRLRLINITQNEADVRVRLLNKGVPVDWKVVAKDGADLPPAQVKLAPADMAVTVGETYDVEYQAATPGLTDLEIREVGFPNPVTMPLRFSDTK